MGRVNDQLPNYVAGAGVYFGLRFIIAFYPALIFTLCIVGICFTPELYLEENTTNIGNHPQPFDTYIMRYDGGVYILGIILFLVLTVVLMFLISNIQETWGIVVFLYIITFFPFMKWLEWLFTSDAGPFPGVNWVPWL